MLLMRLMCVVGLSRRLGLLFAALLLMGCGSSEAGVSRGPAAPVESEPASNLSSPPEAAPAQDVAEIETAPPAVPSMVALEVPGFEPAVVGVPGDQGEQQPAVIVTHGAGGTPEAHCHRWRDIVGARGFLICLRGHVQNRFLPPDARGYFYDGHIELGREAVAAWGAAQKAFGQRLDIERPTFVGYSQGATMGVLAVHHTPLRELGVSALMAIEGGTAEWNVPLSRRFFEAGGRRVGFVCGRKDCATPADRSTPFLERAGVMVRSTHVAGAGHTYLGEVGPEVEQTWRWLTDDDPRWSNAP